MPDGSTPIKAPIRAPIRALSDEQLRAVRAVAAWFRDGAAGRPFFYLAGYAGSGKTTIVPDIIAACGLDPEAHVAFCAPTGKAALVLSRKLQAAGLNVAAKTVHRTIYTPPEVKERGWTDDLTFHRDDQSWVASPGCRLVVVDEASMIGSRIGRDLLAFNTPVLAIGDPGQLPPVEDTGYFTAGEPDFFLAEIHRQARDNPIIALATQVRQGQPLRHGTLGDQVRIAPPGVVPVPDQVQDLPQVICGTHKRRWALTALIRDTLGFEGKLPQAGERLICCRNSQYRPDLINGVGAVAAAPVMVAPDDAYATVVFADDEDGRPLCRDSHGAPQPICCFRGPFDEHELRSRGAVHGDRQVARWKSRELELFDWGWVITTHKSQGSSWDNVLVWDESHVFRDDWRRWLYTEAAIVAGAGRRRSVSRRRQGPGIQTAARCRARARRNDLPGGWRASFARLRSWSIAVIWLRPSTVGTQWNSVPRRNRLARED